MRKCINCKWEGELTVGILMHCPECGDNTEEIELEALVEEPKRKSKKKKDNFDFNNDGKVDAADFSLAERALARRRKKKLDY